MDVIEKIKNNSEKDLTPCIEYDIVYLVNELQNKFKKER